MIGRSTPAKTRGQKQSIHGAEETYIYIDILLQNYFATNIYRDVTPQEKPFTACSWNCGTNSSNRHFHIKVIKFRCSWLTLILHPAALFACRLKLLTTNLKLWSATPRPSGTLRPQHKLNFICCVTGCHQNSVQNVPAADWLWDSHFWMVNWNHIYFSYFFRSIFI